MKGCMETQALVSGLGAYRCISGCIRFSPMACGSVVQIHIRGLPCPSAFYGLSVELNGRRCPLPPILSCGDEAIMSVYVCAFTPADTTGAQIVLTHDCEVPHCGIRIACGTVRPCVSQKYPPPDPRPLFAAPIRW